MNLQQLLKNVGTRISELRSQKKLTQKTFSEKSGITYRYLQTIESGKANITLGTLFRIASFLQVKVPDIICAPNGTGASDIPGDEGSAFEQAVASSKK